MADRECFKCGKVFQYPSQLRNHQARKTPCVRIVDRPAEVEEGRHLCRYCNRVFSAARSLARHTRGACPIAPNDRNGEEGMLVLYEHAKRSQDTGAIVKRLEAEVEALREELVETRALAETRTLTGTRTLTPDGCVAGEQGKQINQLGALVQENSGTVNAANTQVVINIFGKEGVDHVTGERVREILDEVQSGGAPPLPEAAQAAVLKAALLIFSSPEHPENLTAYLPSKKHNEVMVHGGEGWEVQPAQLALAPMALRAIDVLFDKQPYERAEDYTALMRELRDNEARYATGRELRPILVRNKDLLNMALGSLPVARGSDRA